MLCLCAEVIHTKECLNRSIDQPKRDAGAKSNSDTALHLMNSLRIAARRIPAFTASTSASRHARVPSARAFGSSPRGGRGTGQKATTLLKADIPKAEDPLLQYLSSLIMRDGHRHKANKVVALMLQHIHALTGGHPMDIFRAAVAKASPSVRVRFISLYSSTS